MKKIYDFLENHPVVLLALSVLFAVITGILAYFCFYIFDLYCPEVILNEHIAVFAAPVGCMFLYFFIRCVSSVAMIVKEMCKQKLHMQHSKH